MFCHQARRSRCVASLLAALAAALWTPASHADITLQFDLPTAPLGVFGLEFTADFASKVSDIEGGMITATRFHLEFNTAVAPNPFQDAADLAIDFQPPAGDLPIFTLTGDDLGWSGTGQFNADFTTSALNLPIIDFPKGSTLALWFMRIYSVNQMNPALGGQLSNSFIEVDIVTVPAPAAIALLALGGVVPRRSRKAVSAS
jgi:hypothetical protein